MRALRRCEWGLVRKKRKGRGENTGKGEGDSIMYQISDCTKG